MAEREARGVVEGELAGFLKSNETTGEVRTADGRRAVLVTGVLWKALTDSLEGRLAAEFVEVFYTAGHAWGTHAYSTFAEGVSTSRKALYHTRNMGLSDFKQQFNTYLMRRGWGRFDIYEKYDLIFIDLFSSPLPEMTERREMSACSLMAGFFSGFFTELTGVELSCAELRCAGTGADKCTFIVADSSITASVKKWLAKGRGFDDIVGAIGAKEYLGKK